MSFIRSLAFVPLLSSCGMLTLPSSQSSHVLTTNSLPERLLGESRPDNVIYADEAMTDPICGGLPAKVPIVVEKELRHNIFGVIPVIKDGQGNPVCPDWEGNPITQGYIKRTSTLLSSHVDSSRLYCPQGASLQTMHGIQVCIKLNKKNTLVALGPFPEPFVQLCKDNGGGPACAGSTLNAEFVESLLAHGGLAVDKKCALGSSWSQEHDACFDGTNAYGPFTLDQVKDCYRHSGGTPCVSLRWNGSFVKKPVTVDPVKKPGDSHGAYFNAYYDINYFSIQKKAKQFWPHSYGCAAFASTALQMAGFKVEQVLLTNAVEKQLKRLGWKRVSDMASLKPGDVVFTDKNTSNVPGTWSHVYVFHRYHNNNTAIVFDNYGKKFKRNIFQGGGYSTSKVAYRAPD